MSKNLFTNRLNDLFADLQDNEPIEPIFSDEVLPSWSWEVDSEGSYFFIDEDVFQALGLSADKFINQSLFNFHINPQSASELQNLMQNGQFPLELDISFLNARDEAVMTRVMIFSVSPDAGLPGGWRGFTQVLKPISTKIGQTPYASESTPRSQPRFLTSAPVTIESQPVSPQVTQNTNQFWTETANRSLTSGQSIAQNAASDRPAVLAVPIQLGKEDLPAVIEIIDESNKKVWSEDDQLLVEEVSRQLALALENAQLYQAVQQELTERIKAEEVITRRSQDLAALNQAGQQLSKLASQHEILQKVKDAIGHLVDHQNLTIALFNAADQTLSFPIHQVDGRAVPLESRYLEPGIIDHILVSKNPLLINDQMQEVLTEGGIALPKPLPQSLLAIPMLAGERIIGVILLSDYIRKNAYTTDHLELLSTIASQATIALENSNLFQEIHNALQSLETRERYQGNVAKAVAMLTESGTSAIADVLNAIGQASVSNRVYLAVVKEDAQGLYWRLAKQWIDPTTNFTTDHTLMQNIPVAKFRQWATDLHEKGWSGGILSQYDEPERTFLEQQGIRSTLLLPVPGKHAVPGFIAIDQITDDREWQSEEINVLRVAADAISNTFIREDLLEQLQGSLDETETLYNASHQLALANDVDEMLQAISSSLGTTTINRSLLVLAQSDQQNEHASYTVTGSWFSGKGTPPPSNGTQYPAAIIEKVISRDAPLFLDDISQSTFPIEVAFSLAHENIRSLAVLPLWIGKKNLGALLLEAEEAHHFTEREIRSYPPLVDQLATAVENLHLFTQTQEALSETHVLYQISSEIPTARNPQDLISIIGNRVMPKMAKKVGIWQVTRINEEGIPLEFTIVGCFNPQEGCSAPGLVIPTQKLPVWSQSTTDTAIFNTLDSLDPVSKETFQELGFGSGIFIPLSSGQRLIGFLAAVSDQPAEYTPEEVRMFQVAAGSISVALEKQRLLSEAQQRALELQTAAEIARDTTSTLSMDILLERMVNLIRDRFGFYHASIFLVDESGRFAGVRESTGEAGRVLKERNHRLAIGSRSVIGSVTSTGSIVCLNDVFQSPLYYPNPLLPETRSETGIPLKLGDRIIGALDLQSTTANAFSQDDLTVLQILADQIAVAVENARAYELSQHAYEEMKEVDRLKSQFLANMSHELRTPLNSIIGFSRVILKGIDGPINETQQQDLTAIHASGQHLLTLINNILDLSKIEAGKMELQYSEINLADLINSVMSTAVGLVKDLPVKLHQVVPIDLPAVQADPTRIRQVLLNFVSNAAKFTEQGSITVEASRIKSPAGKSEIMVAITDTGAGIAAEDQHKLFQPFSQVDDSPTRKTGGTGLGLSICRSFIDMHKGRIGLLRSEVGVGSTFFFTIPLQETSEPLPEVQGTNIILSIDDDLQVISLYERFLRSQGYQVIPLTNPKEAVKKAKEINPYAITLDIMMPELDGWSVMQALKSDPETRHIPIIICSIMEDEEKGFSLGASDYLVKPFLQEDLITAINRLDMDGKIKKILVIDDNPDDLRLVKKMLEESQSFEIITAEGGNEGWNAIMNHQPDAIILDLFMPDMNGFTLLSNVRSDKNLMGLPVIVLTGADLTPEHIAQVNQFGQIMLNKSVLREKELLATLEQALKKMHH